MAGVFLSYARFDSELGERIVAGLRSLDVECWWDRDMPGVDWPREIERQIDAMSALVVIWTAASKDSKYVRAEAIPAFDREKLINIMFGVKEPPLPFNLYNGFQLDDWSGREPHEGWTRLVRTLEAKLVKTGEVKQGQLVAALGRREQGVRRRQAGLTAAQEAFAAAKAADGESEGELEKARAALTRAEEQLSQLSAMHAGPNVIRGAQADLDDARGGVQTAEAARQAAAGELAGASRALARAKTALDSAFVSPPELIEPVPEGEEVASTDASADDASLDDVDAPAPPRATARPASTSPSAGQPASSPASSPAAAATVASPPSAHPATASPTAAPARAAQVGQAGSANGAGAPAAAAQAAAALGGATAASATLAGAGLGAASAGPTSLGPGGSATEAGPTSLSDGPTSLDAGPTSLGADAGSGKPSSPMPLLVGGGAVLVVGLLALLLFSGHHPKPAPVNTAAIDATANATVDASNAPAAAPVAPPAPPAAPADPVIVAAQAMEGDWGGNGAVCGSNPLTVTVDPAARTVRMTTSNTPSVGSLVGLRSSDNAVQLSFSGDGHTEYDSVSGDTLTLGFNTGSMTYQRCKT